MDFVVVGFGLGALGVLLGVVMLGWLAPRAQRAAARITSPEDAARCQALAAQHRGMGQAFLYSGCAMLLATVAGLVGSLDDRTGAFLVTTTATVAALGILLAGYLQHARNPVPSRRRTRSVPPASASKVSIPPPVAIPSILEDEPPYAHDPAPAESAVEESHTEIQTTGDPDEEAIITEDGAPSASEVSDELSSNTTDPDPLGAVRIRVESPDSGSWQPVDQRPGNGSEVTDSAETIGTEYAGHVAPAARLTESSPSGTDEEDPPPNRQT